MHELQAKPRLLSAIQRGEPLVELDAKVMGGCSNEVAQEAANRLSELLFAAATAYGPGSIRIEAHPQYLMSIGVRVIRERIGELPQADSEIRARMEGTYFWRIEKISFLTSLLKDTIEDICLSQPGLYDDGQPWDGRNQDESSR